MLRFRSRPALWLVRIAVALPVVLLLGWPVFEFGDCSLGMAHAGTCEHIPNWIGNLAIIAVVAAYAVGLYVSPGLIVVGVVLEILARRR